MDMLLKWLVPWTIDWSLSKLIWLNSGVWLVVKKKGEELIKNPRRIYCNPPQDFFILVEANLKISYLLLWISKQEGDYIA